jgi:hypothetical protein
MICISVSEQAMGWHMRRGEHRVTMSQSRQPAGQLRCRRPSGRAASTPAAITAMGGGSGAAAVEEETQDSSTCWSISCLACACSGGGDLEKDEIYKWRVEEGRRNKRGETKGLCGGGGREGKG